jgi:hypothetical protein
VLPHSSSHWSGAEQLQALRAVDVYIKHPLRCEHSAPPSCLACDSQSILVAYADGFLGSASWLGKVRRRSGARAAAAVARKHALLLVCCYYFYKQALHPAVCTASMDACSMLAAARAVPQQQRNSSHVRVCSWASWQLSGVVQCAQMAFAWDTKLLASSAKLLLPL